jgi:serine/threonine protein phosphatase PrpC
MSRSLGDRVAHSVGVSCEPEIKEILLNENDNIIILASDGVWEFLSNDEVANTVIPFFEKEAPEAAANALVKAAFKKWKEEEEVVDDITAVVIFLSVHSNSKGNEGAVGGDM